MAYSDTEFAEECKRRYGTEPTELDIKLIKALRSLNLEGIIALKHWAEEKCGEEYAEIFKVLEGVRV